MSDPKPPEPPRVDPAVIQQWRDRQLKNIPKEKLSKAEEITAANRLAELFNNPQVLHGKLTRTGASGGTVQVALDKPYKGLSSIPATVATGCDRFGKVTLLPDKDKNWYAFGGGVEKVRSARDKERSGDDTLSVTGAIAYCYSVFLKRRVNAGANYKWFWQVWIGGFLAENILVKEWEIPEEPGTGEPQSVSAPFAIVDFRDGTFYVSLQYIVWNAKSAPPSSQQRYALFKGTNKEDLEPEWDKSTREMLPSLTSLFLSPRGFGYWSSDVFVEIGSPVTTYQLWNGAINAYSQPLQTSFDFNVTIPYGWVLPLKTAIITGVLIEESPGFGSGGSNDRIVPALYRLSEDGKTPLGSEYKRNENGPPPSYALSGNFPSEIGSSRTVTGTSKSFRQSILQGVLAIDYKKEGSFFSVTTITVSGPIVVYSPLIPEIIKIDMPKGGGNLPFMAKNATIGNAFTDQPPKPAIASGSVIPSLTSMFLGSTVGAGSPYLADVHDEYISAILCPDLLNRGTVETQNIYGDLSPIFPLVGSLGDLAAMTGLESGVSYGVRSVSKVFTFNISSAVAVDGTTVIVAYGGYGRWLYKEDLPASPVAPDDKKLPGELFLSGIFPEMKGNPPASDWIGYKNIEHENRMVKVYLWDHKLTKLQQEEPIELEVEKIDAIALILEDKTLQTLLSYTFFNASYGG